MTNKGMFAGIIVQVALDIIFYFAVYSAATIIIKEGLDSFGEVVALAFVVKVIIVHTYEEMKEGESLLLHKLIDKVTATLVALTYWGLAFFLIA